MKKNLRTDSVGFIALIRKCCSISEKMYFGFHIFGGFFITPVSGFQMPNWRCHTWKPVLSENQTLFLIMNF